MQLADKLEAKQAMAKADWEFWKKLQEQFEQIHGLFLFDSDDDNQESKLVGTHAQEIDIMQTSHKWQRR